MQFIGTDFLVKKQNRKRPQSFPIDKKKIHSSEDGQSAAETIPNR